MNQRKKLPYKQSNAYDSDFQFYALLVNHCSLLLNSSTNAYTHAQ